MTRGMLMVKLREWDFRSKGPQDDELVDFGKHQGVNYLHLIENLPSYSDWVIAMDGNDPACSKGLRRVALYIRRKRMEQELGNARPQTSLPLTLRQPPRSPRLRAAMRWPRQLQVSQWRQTGWTQRRRTTSRVPSPRPSTWCSRLRRGTQSCEEWPATQPSARPEGQGPR